MLGEWKNCIPALYHLVLQWPYTYLGQGTQTPQLKFSE